MGEFSGLFEKQTSHGLNKRSGWYIENDHFWLSADKIIKNAKDYKLNLTIPF